MTNRITPTIRPGHYAPYEITQSTSISATTPATITLSFDRMITATTDVISWTYDSVTGISALLSTSRPPFYIGPYDGAPYLTVDWAGSSIGVGGRKRSELPPVESHRGGLARAAKCPSPFGMVSPEELVALRLLRSMVSPEAFRRYLKHQLVTVTGPSGLQYDIHRTERICVRLGAQYLATLCVHLSRSAHCPPTDEVVAKMLMAELDEPDLWRRSNHRLAPGLNVANIQPLRDLRIAA